MCSSLWTWRSHNMSKLCHQCVITIFDPVNCSHTMLYPFHVPNATVAFNESERLYEVLYDFSHRTVRSSRMWNHDSTQRMSPLSACLVAIKVWNQMTSGSCSRCNDRLLQFAGLLRALGTHSIKYLGIQQHLFTSEGFIHIFWQLNPHLH